MYRRWVSVKRSQRVGFSSVAWVSSRTPSPKRSAAFEMISRSANSCPRVAAAVRPISLPRLPAVSEMATILMTYLLPENTNAPAGRHDGQRRHRDVTEDPDPATYHPPTLGRSGPGTGRSLSAEKDPGQAFVVDYRAAPPWALARLGHRLQRVRVLEGREIAGLAAEIGRADHAPHDLRRARLRQVASEQHALGLERLTHLVGHALGQLGPQRLRRSASRLEDDEADDGLALDLVRHADDAGLGHGRVSDQDRLDLGGAQTLAGNLQRVVGAALEKPEAVVVDHGPVAVDPHTGPARPVRLLVARGIAPEALRHARPRLRHHQLTDLTAHRAAVVAEDVGGHPRDGPGERARLERRDREAAEDAAGDLCPTRVVDDGQARASDLLEEPAIGQPTPP